MADAAVGFLLENLMQYMKYNYELISGAEESFKKLRDELDFLKGYLQECTEKYDDKGILDNLANSVRNLVHKAEDAVETFIVETTKQKLRDWFQQKLHKAEFKAKVLNLAKQIEQISADVRDFYKNKANLGIEAMKRERLPGAEEGAKNLKPPVDDTVVGLEDETKIVIDLLTEGSEQLDVISIVGMFGLGKTTLAKKVFNHSKIEYHFFIRAFVEVSQDFKKKEVFLKILSAFGQVTDEMQKKSEEDLAKHIKEYLNKRNYLVVLDDVWSKETWEALKGAFPINDKRSRVLITTRNIDVAENARLKTEPHSLRFLRPDESRELLRLKVFDGNKCPTNLEELEALILDRCKGLPLAIVVIAGILRNHRDQVHWWKQVAKGVENYDPKAKEQTDYVIKLSFNHLPYDLKPCFLYLGVFREDSEISARTLLRLWIAEGFIPPPTMGRASSEDIAAFYLQMLVDRSLVMVQKRSSNGQVKTIKIHDILREFCKDRAQKENLFLEIKSGQAGNTSTDNDRRLCVNSNVPDYIRCKPSGKHVRSFLCFAKEDFTLPLDKISSIPKAFQLLRVLDIRSMKLTRFPPELYCLVLLKYIAISCNLDTLPQKMSNLWNLQTLVVQTTARTFKIKADIWKMPYLRHVDITASAILPIKTGEYSSENQNLQTLSTISPESCKKEVFDSTPILKKLGIRGKLSQLFEAGGELSLFRSLSKLQFLENLKLLNETADKIGGLPGGNNFPGKLTKLTLLNTLLDWKHMSTLGKLKNLEVLKLKENAFEGIMWETEDGGFKHLRVLHIGATKLTVWKAAASNFPMLTDLYLKHCEKLEGIPLGLEGISTFQMIDLHCNNPPVAISARRLQVAKLQAGEKFKLNVYPPDQ